MGCIATAASLMAFSVIFIENQKNQTLAMRSGKPKKITRQIIPM
jgi:hypothetical protein